MSDDDFYVEDEPLEDIIAAWNAGEKGYTAPPVRTYWSQDGMVSMTGAFNRPPEWRGQPMITAPRTFSGALHIFPV